MPIIIDERIVTVEAVIPAPPEVKSCGKCGKPGDTLCYDCLDKWFWDCWDGGML